MTHILIQHGRIIDPAQHYDAIGDLQIVEGKIIEHSPHFTPEITIDASQQLVIPGLIDSYAAIRDEAGYLSQPELNAALAGGISTMVCPPDGAQVIDAPHRVRRLLPTKTLALSPHVYPVGALTQGLQGQHIADLTALHQAGCIAFSHALAPSPLNILRNAYAYAASFALPIIIQANEPSLGRCNGIHEGAVNARLGLPSIPELAETIAIAQHLLLIEATQVKAHFTGISTAAGVAQIRQAQQQGLAVTADVSIAHLHLTEVDLLDFNSNCHLFPPLRSQRDQFALRQGLQQGVLSGICSYHQPQTALSKRHPFAQTSLGCTGLETLLPLGLHLVAQQILDLPTLVARLTHGPAQYLGLNRGHLAPGALADICIVDPKARSTVNPALFKSNGHNSPFSHWELPGRVMHTLIEGKLAYSANTLENSDQSL